MIELFIIGGVLAGMGVSVPVAVGHARKALSAEAGLHNEGPSPQTAIVAEPSIVDVAKAGNVEIKSTSVYRTENSRKATFNLVFQKVAENVPKVGMGIVSVEVFWVNVKNATKTKSVTEADVDIKQTIFLLDNDKPRTIPVSVHDEKHMKINHIKLKLYEGGASKTHKVQMRIEDYTYMEQ